MSANDKKSGVSEGDFPNATEADIVPLGDKLRARWGQPLRQVDAYWEAMRTENDVPARSNIDPRGIESALEYAFIAERIAPTHARLRIGGTHLCDLMGMEVRGMPLSAMLVPVSRDRLAAVLRQVFESPARAELSLVSEKRLGKPELAGRLLLLPLSDDFGDVSRVLGCLVSDGSVGRAPRRFEIVQSEITELRPKRKQPAPAPPRQPIPAPPRQPVASFAEPKVEFKSGPVPYLKLVTADD